MSADPRNGRSRSAMGGAGAVILLLIAAIGWGGHSARADDGVQALVMADYLHARWPSRPAWSPNGRRGGLG